MSLRLLHSRTEIAKRVERLGQEIQDHYRPMEALDLVILIPLSGAFVFAADLIREIYLPMKINFVRCSSYGGGRESRDVTLRVPPGSMNMHGKDVLIVEDIIHTGKTLNVIMGYLHGVLDQPPRSIEVCAFLKHPDAPNDKIVKWVGFTALPDEFVVGYGMDLEEENRNYPGVMIIE